MANALAERVHRGLLSPAHLIREVGVSSSSNLGLNFFQMPNAGSE